MLKSDFILDCSITMAWCFLDEASNYATEVRDQLLLFKAKVPTLWSIEVANVLWAAETKKRITKYQSLKFKDLLDELPIIIDTETSNRAMNSTLDLARDQKITVYDAAYLDLALHENLPIATLDKELQQAAKRVDVSLF